MFEKNFGMEEVYFARSNDESSLVWKQYSHGKFHQEFQKIDKWVALFLLMITVLVLKLHQMIVSGSTGMRMEESAQIVGLIQSYMEVI